MTNLHDVGEFGLIAHLQQRLRRRAGVRIGIGDDAAVLESLAAPIVTCDALIEGVHFRRDWTRARLLGRKAIAVNVSDIAAMGGRPVAAFVTLALSAHDDLAWIEELYVGMEEAAALYDLTLAGGDTTRAPHISMLSITLVGDAPRPILRSGAQAGDVLLATGTLGDAAAGLALLQNSALIVSPAARDGLLARHFNPTARLGEMQAALDVTAGASHDRPLVKAALDLSDGLAGDAAHMARASSVGIEIEVARLPLSQFYGEAVAAAGAAPYEWALRGGEDYELLLCVAPGAAPSVAAAIAATGTLATVIGRCIDPEIGGDGERPAAEPVILMWPDGRREAAGRAWTHF